MFPRSPRLLPRIAVVLILAWPALRVQAQPAAETKPKGVSLQIPPGLPGADAPPLQLPAHPKEREAAIERLFPTGPSTQPRPGELPAVDLDLEPRPGPDGQPLTLCDLQQLAQANSPSIRAAAAALDAARGAAIQAGLPPNPVGGYEGDTIRQADSAGLQGAFIEQTIKTWGKLGLARAAAEMEVRNAELALRRTEVEVATQVRSGYFAVLVARENVQVTRLLVQFADSVYQVQVAQVKGAQAAPYEPMQMRVLAMQARANLVEARNRHIAAWKQLTAAMGLPDMPLTALAGRVDMPIPRFHYEAVLQQMLESHTDVLSAINTVDKSRYLARLAQVTPWPDVDVRFMLQKDNTTPPFNTVPSVVVGMPIPVWNRNQGGIREAQGNLARAAEDVQRVRNDLTQKLAEAFARYESNRVLLDYYRRYILPDQVRAYRGAYERHQQEPDKVGFGDVVNAQQTLAGTITSYVTSLGSLWSAVVDVANLLQTTDLFQDMQEMECVPPVPLSVIRDQ